MNADELGQYRPLLFSIAYRMTGSVGDAEDIVQEALIRGAGGADVDNPRAYLTTVTTRLAIDHLRSARVRREAYVGMWLPEPLLIDDDDPAGRAELSDSLSMAFLVLLESLTPAERAVFLLREVFGYDYRAIAEATGKSEQSCRQLFTRARRAVGEGRPRFTSSRADAEELTALFLGVTNGGDLPKLMERLAPDVAFYGDSGGRGEVTFRQPVIGRARVGQILAVQLERNAVLGWTPQPAVVNGQPGIVARDQEGALVAVIAFEVRDGLIQAIRVVANPDKLDHLGPVSRIWHERADGDA